MIRTWDEIQGFLVAQGLIESDGLGPDDLVGTNADGAQILYVLLLIFSIDATEVTQELLETAAFALLHHPMYGDAVKYLINTMPDRR